MRRIMSLVLALAILLSLGAAGGVTAFATSEMKASDQVVDLIKEFEGFRAKPYYDYSQWTVGYGTRCPPDKLDEYKANGISKEAAEKLLREFIEDFELAVNYFIDQNDLTLTQNQFDALVCYSYNLGGNWAYATKTNLYMALSKTETVPEEVLYWLATYSFAGGSFLSALTNRRLSEANMYNNGVYSRTRPDNYCYVVLKGNGGEVSNTVCAYDTNSENRIYPKVTRDGYSFAGWFTEANGGNKVETFDQSIHGTVLYAHWTDGEGNDVNMGGTIAGEGNTATLPGEELENPVDVKVQNNGVNLRKGPGTNYTKIGTANKGDKLTISRVAVGGSYTWGYYGQGWIALKYTNYQAAISGDKEDTNPEIPEEETPKTLTGTVKVNESLRIRSGAGTGYSCIGYYYPNNKVTITETKLVGSVTWGKTDKGWISLQYVVLDEVAEDVPVTKPEEETKPEDKPEEETKPEDKPEEETKPETKPEEEAKPETTGVKVTVTNNGVNLRKGPGTNYTKVGTAYKGDQLTITETKQGGSYLWGNYGEGWIALKYTDYKAPSTGGSITQTKPEEDNNDATATGTVTGKVKVNDFLRIRSGAGTGYSCIGYYYPGDKVTITEQKQVGSVTWGKTDKGWISLQYVTLDKVTVDVPVTKPEEDTKEEETTKPEDTTTQTLTGRVDVDEFLRIRSGPGTSYSQVGYLYKDDKVTITETKQVGAVTWGKIDKGWISLDYVDLDGADNSSATAPSGDVKTITASCLRVRKNADISSTVVGYLYYGTKVTILETKTVNGTTWGKISNGWISMDYVR